MNDSGDCGGDFDEGGSDIGETGESADAVSGAVESGQETAGGAVSETGGEISTGAETAESGPAPGGVSIGSLAGFDMVSGKGAENTGEISSTHAHVTENKGVHETAEKPSQDKEYMLSSVETGKNKDSFVPTYNTVSEKSIPEISKAGHKAANTFAAKHCPERARELNEAAKADVTPAKLKDLGDKVQGSRNMRTGEITINSGITEVAATHVAIHEEMHNAAYHSKEYVDNGKTCTETLVSGLRVSVFCTDNKTGAKIESSSKNTALNEGVTEEYTDRAAKQNGYVDNGGITAYSTNRAYATSLESIVGEDMLSEGYFNGAAEELADRMNELGKNENTWSEFNAQLDILTAEAKENMTPEEQKEFEARKAEARQALNNIICRMNIEKMEEEMANDNY